MVFGVKSVPIAGGTGTLIELIMNSWLTIMLGVRLRDNHNIYNIKYYLFSL